MEVLFATESILIFNTISKLLRMFGISVTTEFLITGLILLLMSAMSVDIKESSHALLRDLNVLSVATWIPKLFLSYEECVVILDLPMPVLLMKENRKRFKTE